MINIRVNITEPGLEHKETIKSASMSAASGGITSMICMPNTTPPIDQPAIIHSIQRKAREVALSKIFCTGCITRNFEGKEICELHLMKESGAVGFTDGSRTIQNTRVMRRALSYAKSFNGLVLKFSSHSPIVEYSQQVPVTIILEIFVFIIIKSIKSFEIPSLVQFIHRNIAYLIILLFSIIAAAKTSKTLCVGPASESTSLKTEPFCTSRAPRRVCCNSGSAPPVYPFISRAFKAWIHPIRPILFWIKFSHHPTRFRTAFCH